MITVNTEVVNKGLKHNTDQAELMFKEHVNHINVQKTYSKNMQLIFYGNMVETFTFGVAVVGYMYPYQFYLEKQK